MVVESDSRIVVSALIGSSELPFVIANIIKGIHRKLYEFRRVQFSYVKRQSNRSAHILAQYVKNINSCVT